MFEIEKVLVGVVDPYRTADCEVWLSFVLLCIDARRLVLLFELHFSLSVTFSRFAGTCLELVEAVLGLLKIDF